MIGVDKKLEPFCYVDEPELEDAPAPDWGHFEDECRWDSDRIEATKSILFQEFIGRR